MFYSAILRSKTQLAVMAATVLLALPAAFAVPHSGGNGSGAYLGVHINNLTPEQAAGLKLTDTNGVLVMSLDHDGPACKAGIQADDVIMSVNGTKIGNMQQMLEVMQTLSAGSVATIGIVREGKPKNVKVTLASRNNWTAHSYPLPNNSAAKGFMPPLPPVAFPADADVPLVTPASARRGIVVEALTAQLADYFAVPGGQGVLVRSVQRGSWGASAGLKAGDVIFRIDGQPIRDLADWRGSMHTNNLKTTFSIIRDRHEQTVEMVVPGPAGELRLGEDWDSFGRDTDALNQQMHELDPEIQRQTQQAVQQAMLLRPEDLAKMQREIENSMKQVQPQIEKQVQAAREQMERTRPEIEKQAEEIQKSMAVLQQQDFARMREQIHESLKNLTPQIQEQLQALTPQIQQQLRDEMQQLQKEMQQHQHDMQELMKNWPNSSPQPNQM